METKQLTQRQVMTEHPTAFDALPEAYREDSCLEFWIEGSDLFAAPKPEDVHALGNWAVRFNGTEWVLWSTDP